MPHWTEWVIWSCLIEVVLSVTPQANLSSLRFVTVIWRHGDRSPVGTYASDIHSENDWSQGFGQLTTVGMMQQYHLGTWVRRRYNGFLNSTYVREEIEVHATDYDRTIQSALANLAALYHPKGTQIWDKDLPWFPIPVKSYYTNYSVDPLLCSRDEFVCPTLEKMRIRDSNDAQAIEINKKYASFYKFLSEKSGEDITTFLDGLGHITDTLYCQKMHNMTLPSWVNDTVMNTLIRLSGYSFEYLCRSKAACRLYAASLPVRTRRSAITSSTTSTTKTPRDYHTSSLVFLLHDKCSMTHSRSSSFNTANCDLL